MLMIYNWVTQRWAQAHMNLDMLFRAFTFGYSLDGLDATGYNLDTLPYSLDSRVWTAGQVLLGGFQNNTLGYLSGPNLAASVETDETIPQVPGRLTFINNSRPLVDQLRGSGGIEGVPITVDIYGRMNLADPPVKIATGTVTSLGWAPLRASSRYLRARINVPYGTNFDHLQGTLLQARVMGIR